MQDLPYRMQILPRKRPCQKLQNLFEWHSLGANRFGGQSAYEADEIEKDR